MDINLIFIAQKDMSIMVKGKLHPRQKQPDYSANPRFIPYKHQQSRCANTNLAKN